MVDDLNCMVRYKLGKYIGDLCGYSGEAFDVDIDYGESSGVKAVMIIIPDVSIENIEGLFKGS